MQRTTPERRNVARHWTQKKAHIAFKGQAATIDCTVLNLSDEGALLNVGSSIGIPDSFDLVLNQARVRNCLVTWRQAAQIGVVFA